MPPISEELYARISEENLITILTIFSTNLYTLED